MNDLESNLNSNLNLSVQNFDSTIELNSSSEFPDSSNNSTIPELKSTEKSSSKRDSTSSSSSKSKTGKKKSGKK